MERNIGLFNESFPPVMDGVSVCVENYAYWMQKKVGGVSVITPNNPGTSYADREYEVLDYFSVPVPFRRPYMTGIAEIDPFFLKNILAHEFKIVHAHSPFTSGLVASHIAKLQRIPLVATFHSKYKDDFSRVIPSKLVVKQIIKRIVAFYGRADAVWVPQESVTEVIREYGFKGPVEVVENGSDLVADYPDSYFSDARKDLGIDGFTMLFVGQHIWEKNIRFILEAVDAIRDESFHLFFIGNGYAAEEMKAFVKAKGLEDKITFVGTVTDREKLKRYYAAADLFLFPSLYDNAPLVVKEAAALHTPAIMMEGSTAASIIRDGENGFLTPPDLAVFAGRLRQLIHDPAAIRKAGLGASRTIVRSWEDIVDEVLQRYNDILRRKKLIGTI